MPPVGRLAGWGGGGWRRAGKRRANSGVDGEDREAWGREGERV